MGRRPKNYQPPTVEELNQDPPGPTADESPADNIRRTIAEDREAAQTLSIEDLLESLEGNEAEIAIRKVEMDGGEYQLQRVTVESAQPDLEEFCRTQYGGGKYVVQFFRKGADGKWQNYVKRTVKIHASNPPGEFFKSQKQSAEAPKTDESVTKALLDKIKTDGGGDREMLLAFLQMSQNQSNQMLKMMMDSQANMMTAMGGMVSALRGGGNTGNAPLDMLQMLKVFKELSGGGGNTDPMKLLEFAHKLSKEMGGKDEPGWISALAEFLPKMLENMRPPQQRLPEAIPMPDAHVETAAASAPSVMPAPGTVELQPTTEDDMFLTRMLSVKTLAPAMLPKLIEAIEVNGAEPEDALDMFNNPLSPAMLTEKQFAELVETLKSDTWAKDLFGDEKKIEKHQAWFDKLRELVLKEANEAEGGKE